MIYKAPVLQNVATADEVLAFGNYIDEKTGVPVTKQWVEQNKRLNELTDIEKLNVRTFNNSTSGVLNDKCQDFEKVNTNKTDINNPNKNNTDFNENESKKYKAEEKNTSCINSS